jgi:hypothetical protein
MKMLSLADPGPPSPPVHPPQKSSWYQRTDLEVLRSRLFPYVLLTYRLLPSFSDAC